uniref:Uncharacterized protein n=1 Tax=Ananas comosus var. bracteatus TaxID=296719 RepID=A0A6V7PS00_ANACO|nr:unnamed protein product [Ananas comosus var. bracteatus]
MEVRIRGLQHQSPRHLQLRALAGPAAPLRAPVLARRQQPRQLRGQRSRQHRLRANDDAAAADGRSGGDADEIDPLDAFMEGINEEIRAPPPPPPPPPPPGAAKEKVDRYEGEDDDDPVESFLRAKKDVGLALAADALHAGYNSDEEVYAAAKAVDAG